jgi:hypothetical protein
MNPTSLPFRDQCALTLLNKWADKVFDKEFRRLASDAGLEAEELLTAHIEEMVEAMCRAFP